jgi:hypothetical protein
MDPNAPHSLSRREAIERILAVTALAAATQMRGFAAELNPPLIGWDPDLLKKEIPWPRIMTPEEKRLATALGDLLVPADEFGPAASAVGVPDFLDEWISAPYEPQVKDRKTIRDGLAWFEAEAKRRFSKGFADCPAGQQTAILTDIVTEGTPARKEAHSFFLLFRDRVLGAYYTTPAGWKALGYTGNVPQLEFAGPPVELLQKLGLA